MMNNRPGTNARGGTPPQTEAFKEVIAEEISRLLAQGNFTVPVGHTVSTRQLNFLHTVWSGFNSDDECNEVLGAIATTYARLRLGFKPFEVLQSADPVYDEFWAAILACTIQLEIHEAGATGGTGLWALPIVHALNLHLQYCTSPLISP